MNEFDPITWLVMFATAVVSWCFGRDSGYRAGRRAGFRSGHAHGAYWTRRLYPPDDVQ